MPEATNNTPKKAVRYGIERAYYALLQDDGTYGTPKRLMGAVAATLAPSGQSNNFYADNEVYAVFNTNSGYTGNIELAYLEKEARKDLLGERIDAIGGVFEDSEAQPNRVAIMFQTNGNVRNKRVVLYDVTFKRPEEAANTTTESTDPDTETLELVAVPKEVPYGEDTVKVPKYSLASDDEDGTAAYKSWFEEVKFPVAAAA